MNRRSFFHLLAGASAVALAPSMVARPDYTKGQTFTFKPVAHNTGPMTLQMDGGPVRVVVQYRERGSEEWTTLEAPDWYTVPLDDDPDIRLSLA